MKYKSLVTILLLVFVGASVGFLVFKESRNSTEAKEQTVQAPVEESLPAEQPEMSEETKVSSTTKKAEAKQDSAHPVTQSSQTAPVNPARKVESPRQSTPSSKVVAYYFHGNTRCATCRMIESLSRVAVTSGFPDEMKNGRVEFRAINVEDPGNEHFVQDYKLVTRSVVLARFSGEKQEKWKNLDRVWELVRNSEAFDQYVREETKSFLEGS